MSYSDVYAQALNIDINTLREAPVLIPPRQDVPPVGEYIPKFLIKHF
jgi:hypothetical protein